MDAQRHISLRDYTRILKKRRNLIAAFALAGLALGTFNYFRATHAFRSTSQVLIERPNNFVIGTSLTTATSTKQQMKFLNSQPYQALARSLTELSFRIPLDLTDQALMDDIGTVMVRDVLDSRYVTPARLVKYQKPSASLLSSEQEKTITDAPALAENLRLLARLGLGESFDLTEGWDPRNVGRNNTIVWSNLERLAVSPVMYQFKELGVTMAAAEREISARAEGREDRLTGARLEMAATMLGALIELDAEDRAETYKSRGVKIQDMTNGQEVVEAAGPIMSSKYVTGLLKLSDPLKWDELTAEQKRTNIEQAREALWVQNRRSPQGPDSVRQVMGKEAEEGADIIQINQLAADPVTSRTAANAMAAIMVWKDRMTKVASSERSIRFLKDQLGDGTYGVTKELADSEDALTSFRRKHGFVDLPTTLSAAVQNAATLESAKNEAEASLGQAAASLRDMKAELGARGDYAVGRTISQNPVVGSIKSELVKAETELASMEANYEADYPPLMAKRAAVENLRQRLQEEARNSVSETFTPDPVQQQLAQRAADLSAQQVGLQARRDALARLLNQVNGKFENLPTVQADMVRLMRVQSLAERRFMVLYERLLDAQNQREMGQGNARVVELALEPGLHASPRYRNIIFAMILGTFLGALCALALSSTDTHLRSSEDIQRELGLPVLAHLPEIPSGHTLVVESLPAAAITEAFRALRSTIRFMGGEKPLRTIAATSTRAAEGKSTVVANLAASLAQAGLTVTAVDADLRRPSLGSFFGLQNTAGLSDALAAKQASGTVRQATRIPGLWVMTAGTTPENPGELLDNGRIARVLDELKEGNDMLIVDTPPIGVVTDAALVGSAADATVLIIDSGTVEPDEARAALTKLKDHARANVIGVVLVGGDAPISEDYVRYVSVEGGNGNGHARNGGSRRQRQTRVNR